MLTDDQIGWDGSVLLPPAAWRDHLTFRVVYGVRAALLLARIARQARTPMAGDVVAIKRGRMRSARPDAHFLLPRKTPHHLPPPGTRRAGATACLTGRLLPLRRWYGVTRACNIVPIVCYCCNGRTVFCLGGCCSAFDYYAVIVIPGVGDRVLEHGIIPIPAWACVNVVYNTQTLDRRPHFYSYQ